MGRQGSRRRIDTGIYVDKTGYAVVATVGTKPNQRRLERRFPFSLSKIELRAERDKLLGGLRIAAPVKTPKGSFEADVDEYLKTVPDGPSRNNARILLGHWKAAPGFNAISRHQITPVMIAKQIATWLSDDVAPSTVNKRRTALMSLYRKLDGAGGRNPVREVRRQQEDSEEARGFSYELVEKILAALPDRGRAGWNETRSKVSQTKARLRVMAYTGLPPAVLARIDTHHLHLDDDEPSVDTLPRRKGRRTKGKRIPLNDRAVKAFRALLAAKALGPFSTSSMRASFKRAVDKAKADWIRTELKNKTRRPWPLPTNVRPYDLRHAFGTETLRRTGDLQATSELMLHADIRTTMRYLRAAVSEQAQKAVTAWNAPRRRRKAG